MNDLFSFQTYFPNSLNNYSLFFMYPSQGIFCS